MPFKSESQRRYMFSKHPKIAKEWQAKTKGDLPEKVGSLLCKIAVSTMGVGPRRGTAALQRLVNKDVINSSGVGSKDLLKKAYNGVSATSVIAPKTPKSEIGSFKGAVPQIKDQGKTTIVLGNKNAIPKVATLSDLYKKRLARMAANVPINTHEVQGGIVASGPTAKMRGQV